MKVFLPPLHERIEDDDSPFSVDVFGRKDFADNLTRLFRNCENGLVVTVDSEWGAGKTTLVKLWEKQLEKDPDFIPIYYDAFKNDFTSDAFMSIAVLIHDTLTKVCSEAGRDLKNEAQFKHLKSSLKELAKGFVKTTAIAGMGALTGGVVDSKGVVELSKKALENLAFGTLELDVEQKFKAHSESMKLVEEYQKALKEILQPVEGQSPRKIVFIVDELDRCRPDFAVQVIEKIKHLFSIDNIHFVLAVNKSQLLHTISSAYGVTPDDASTYLQKFVHLETKLPKIDDLKKDVDTLSLHFEKLLTDFGLSLAGVATSKMTALKELVGRDFFDLNLREFERLFGLVSIYSMTSETVEKDLSFVFALAALKVSAVSVYEGLRSGRSFTQGTKDPAENMVYRWLKKHRSDFSEITAPNSIAYSVDAPNVFSVLEIYDFPGEQFEKKRKQERYYEGVFDSDDMGVRPADYIPPEFNSG